MLQKLEGDVRQHIRIEQQLKLHIESIQEKLEEDEKIMHEQQDERDRFAREKARMDEMLTIREREIIKLENKVKALSITIRDKDNSIKESQLKLSEAKAIIEEQRKEIEREKNLMTRIHKLEDSKSYSRSNGRRDRSGSNNPESKIINSAISQSSIPKKSVSRMYASLYHTNQSTSKPQNDYERKGFKSSSEVLEANKFESSKRMVNDKGYSLGTSSAMCNSGVFNSKTTEARNESNRKCKKKRKDTKESDRKSIRKNSNRKKTVELSRSKEKRFDSKVDFYMKSKPATNDSFSQHRTYDDQDRMRDEESKDTSKRIMGQSKKSAVISDR